MARPVVNESEPRHHAEGLSLAEAMNRCAGHGVLVGTSRVGGDRTDTVEAIVPAPVGMRDQWVFYNLYCQTNDLEHCLKQYEQDLFDVIILLRTVYADGTTEQHYKTLDHFLGFDR